MVITPLLGRSPPDMMHDIALSCGLCMCGQYTPLRGWAMSNIRLHAMLLHQVLTKSKLLMLAGRNGPSTSWAQPSGISLSADGSQLWVADSESSAVRSMSLATGGSQASHGTHPQ